MSVKELIDQIGGRAALQDLIDNPRMANCDETAFLARALLAVLDAKPVAFTDDEGLRNVKNGTYGEMFNGNYIDKFDGQWLGVYLTPPAASVPDGWKLAPIDSTRLMIDAARAAEEDGYDAMLKAMLAAAPAPGGKA